MPIREKDATPCRGLTKLRFDRIEQPIGGMAALWAFRGGSEQSMVREYLGGVYTIPKQGKYLRADMTHEFNLFMLSPKVPINFDINIFTQSKLIPIKPAAIGCQFSAEDDERAVLRARRFIEMMRHFETDLDLSNFNHWLATFPDAIPLCPDKAPLKAAA